MIDNETKSSSPLTNVRGILLDIEGTTSSISFVHDVMFPYVLERLEKFLHEHWQREDVQAACQQVAIDAGHTSLDSWSAAQNQQRANTAQTENQQLAVNLVSSEVRRLMAADVKATGLKALQGLIWEGGFRSGELQSHVYSDVLPAIRSWREAGLDVRIYSSGSIAAQKLFFGHVKGVGDCLSLFSGHYDTTIGGKKESHSYQRIAAEWGLPASEILFISDIAAELVAASAAGLQTRASVRPGNTPLPTDFSIEQIDSFAEVHPN